MPARDRRDQHAADLAAGGRLLITRGMSYAGKTTFVRILLAHYPIHLVDLDDINAARGVATDNGTPVAQWQQTYKIAGDHVRRALTDGEQTIVCGPNPTRWHRDMWRDHAVATGATAQVIYFETSWAEIQRRRDSSARAGKRPYISDDVLLRRRRMLQPPRPDEKAFVITPADDPVTWIRRHLGPEHR